MVGFYSESPLPLNVAPIQSSITTTTSPSLSPSQLSSTTQSVGSSVRKVVCSPDLPIPPDFATAAAKFEQQSIQCPLCNKVFTSESSYQTHQHTHNKETDDPYRCNICSKTFAVPARLTRHYRTHTGEKPFKCEFCDKSFSVKENLSVHRRIHTKERPYVCDVCSRAFEHSGKLHRHMRIHTGERPHKCTVCSKTFIQSGQLVIHMRTHTGEKPYVCNVCQKGFTCSKQLKVHSRTHTGEKPYSCEICGKSFGYNHVLKLHQVAHYGEKVYKCTICNDTFNSKKSMEAHIKSHSENNAPVSPLTTPSESSCSSTSDKENKDTFTNLVVTGIEPPAMSYDADLRYYFYSARDRLSPTNLSYYHHAAASATTTSSSSPIVNNLSSGVELLAEAASVSDRISSTDNIRNHETVLNLISRNSSLRHPAYFSQPNLSEVTALNAGDDIRRRVEAALAVEDINEGHILTPPSSNPVSPLSSSGSSVSDVQSLSSDHLDEQSTSLHTSQSTRTTSTETVVGETATAAVLAVHFPDPELSLPPRKRSKMILKSMETTFTTKDFSPVRYSSVIQYARAS